MNVLTLPLAALMLVSIAFAASADVSAGTVLRFDSHPHTMTLTTGEIILLPADVNVDQINAGDYVTVTWTMIGSDQVASSVFEDTHGQ
jgi:hypothetical protein